MKKTILALVLVIAAFACEFAPKEENNTDSSVAPVIVDTIVPPVGADTLVNLAGDTIIREIQK